MPKHNIIGLFQSLRDNDPDVVIEALTDGFSIETTNIKDGCNLFHCASGLTADHSDVIDAFIDVALRLSGEKFINLINSKNKDGKTPLHYAALLNNKKTAQSLIEVGANIDLQDNQGKTPLHYACEHENEEIMDLLLRSDANIEALDAANQTPLHTAVKSGKVDIVRKLLISGAKTNITNSKGKSPLHYAVKKENVLISQLLIASDANIYAKDRLGKTAIDYAEEQLWKNSENKNSRKIMAYLVQKKISLAKKEISLSEEIGSSNTLLSAAEISEKSANQSTTSNPYSTEYIELSPKTLGINLTSPTTESTPARRNAPPTTILSPERLRTIRVVATSQTPSKNK